MKRKTKQFLAAFAATCILITGFCGFVLVDLRAENYLSGNSETLFEVEEVTSEGLSFTVFGTGYVVDSTRLDPARERIWSWRGFFPRSMSVAATILTKGYLAAQEIWEMAAQPEVPW